MGKCPPFSCWAYTIFQQLLYLSILCQDRQNVSNIDMRSYSDQLDVPYWSFHNRNCGFCFIFRLPDTGSVQYRECLKSRMAELQGTTLDILLKICLENSLIGKPHWSC